MKSPKYFVAFFSIKSNKKINLPVRNVIVLILNCVINGLIRRFIIQNFYIQLLFRIQTRIIFCFGLISLGLLINSKKNCFTFGHILFTHLMINICLQRTPPPFLFESQMRKVGKVCNSIVSWVAWLPCGCLPAVRKPASMLSASQPACCPPAWPFSCLHLFMI